MSTQTSTQTSNPDSPSTTLGVGGPTSGEQGATLTDETMAETGGSGAESLAQPRDGAPVEAGNAESQSEQPEGAGPAATATARGAQDTRASQAGRLLEGLGTPETGGNQTPDDLAPPRGQ